MDQNPQKNRGGGWKYCWWFRNPAHHLESNKKAVNNRMNWLPMKQNLPGDSIRDLTSSPIVGGHQPTTISKGHVNSPSQKRSPAELPGGRWWFEIICLFSSQSLAKWSNLTCARGVGSTTNDRFFFGWPYWVPHDGSMGRKGIFIWMLGFCMFLLW